MADALKTIIAAFILVIVLLVGTNVVGVITEDESGLRTDESEAVLLNDAGTYTQIAHAEGFNEEVHNSLGNAVVLAGTDDSYVQSDSNIDFATDDTWTVSVWAKLSDDALVQNRALLSLNGQLVITYYPMQGNWSAWYYDEGATNSYQVNVTAENVNSDLQNVMVRSNGTHLAIYQNNTRGDVKNITTEQITDAPASMANWHGPMDEVRVYDDALDDTNRSAVVDSPVAPLPDTNRTARIMFDETDKDEQLIFFTSASLTQSNVSFGDGLDGKQMDGQGLINDITGETDYVWDTEGPRIYIVEGGELNGAPVAYIDYELEEALSGVVDSWASFAQLSAIIPLVAIFLVIYSRIRQV